MNIFHYAGYLLRGIQVFALVGKSGTGKSFRAQLVAQKYGIELIIDDGLLIRDQKILAGRSAKKEKGYLAAVRTAVFDDAAHRREVRECITRQKFKRILVIGTSDRMVRRIADRLELPPVSRILRIEDIATEDEIEVAMRTRQLEGKHVIPVPAIEVKRRYSSIFYDSVRIFLRNRLNSKPQMIEKAVVRPEFSRQGRVKISESAITQMILHCVREFSPGINVRKITVRPAAESYRLAIDIEVAYGVQLSGNIHQLQRYIIDNIEQFTGLIIDELDVTVQSISEQRPEEPKKRKAGTPR